MGTFYTGCEVENQIQSNRVAHVPKLLVDTGSESTWIAEHTLQKLNIRPVKEISFIMADGSILTRSVGFAIIRIGEYFTTDEVVFAQKGDLQLLGARTMEGLGLIVDPRRKRLVASGPHLAACAA